METNEIKVAKKIGIQVVRLVGYALIAYVVTWTWFGNAAYTFVANDFDQLAIINHLYLQNVVVIFLGCLILEKLYFLRKELKGIKKALLPKPETEKEAVDE